MPRLRSETIGAGDQSWLGSDHGIWDCPTATIDPTLFTPATHYPNGYLPSGLPVNTASEGAVKPWTGAAGEVLGFLFTNQAVFGNAKIPAPILRHGSVRVNRLPITFTPPTTFVGFTFRGTGA